MRIAMIGQKGIPAHSGGVEQVVDMLTRQLTARGHEVIAYCRRSYHGRDARSTREGNLTRVFRPSIPTKHLDAITHTLTSTLDVAVRRADVVHYHAIGPAALAPLARLAGLPVVVTVHGLDWQRAKWGGVAKHCLRLGEWLAARTATRLTVVSPVLRDYFATHYGAKAEFIPNGVVPITRRPAKHLSAMGLKPQRYLLAVSRLVPEKGLHYLIDAFTSTSHDLKLVIAGGPGLDASYEQQLKRTGDPRVVFAGAVDRDLLAELYSHARMFVLPSDLEGMSIALLEAMSMSLPVLVSDIPENTTVVGNAGLTFRAGDVADLQRVLDAALAEPNRLTDLGARAKQKVEPFQWPHVVDQFEAVYHAAAGLPVPVRAPSLVISSEEPLAPRRSVPAAPVPLIGPTSPTLLSNDVVR